MAMEDAGALESQASNNPRTMMTVELRQTLPKTDAYVGLSLLDGGSFVGETGKMHANVVNSKFRMYDWAFYISHQGRHVLWDLGLDEVRNSFKMFTAALMRV